jgi:hypothetical protein
MRPFFFPSSSAAAAFSMVLIFGGSPAMAGSTPQETADYFKSCQKFGLIQIHGKKILSFEEISGGVAIGDRCLIDLTCKAEGRKDFRDQLVCGFNVSDGCEVLSDCLAMLPQRPEYVFTYAKAETGVNQKCENQTEEHVLTQAWKADPDRYESVCIKELTCQHGGRAVYHPLVACKPAGRKLAPHTDGKEYEFDFCPSNDKCLANRIDLLSDVDHIAKIRAEKKLAVEQTNRRGADASLQSKSAADSHKKRDQ